MRIVHGRLSDIKQALGSKRAGGHYQRAALVVALCGRINQKSKAMKEYYLADANFSVEDSECYRANLLACIYLLMKEG